MTDQLQQVLDKIDRMQVVEIRPGDVLVVRTTEPVSRTEEEFLRDSLPGTRIWIIRDTTQIGVLRQESGDK